MLEFYNNDHRLKSEKTSEKLSVKTSLGFCHLKGFTPETNGLQTKRYLPYVALPDIYLLVVFIVILLPHKCAKKNLQYPTYYVKILEIVEISK